MEQNGLGHFWCQRAKAVMLTYPAADYLKGYPDLPKRALRQMDKVLKMDGRGTFGAHKGQKVGGPTGAIASAAYGCRPDV